MPDAKPERDVPATIIEILTGREQLGCLGGPDCAAHERHTADHLVGRYVGHGTPAASQIVVAWLDLRGLQMPDYMRRVRKFHKGNAIRQAHRARRVGCDFRPFDPRERTTDIVEINQSMSERCGRPMSRPYQRTVEELVSAMHEGLEFQSSACPRHYDRWWGAFVAESSSDPRRDRLVGYIRLRRRGTFAMYAQLLGHGEYLRDGVMHGLHFAVLSWLCHRDEAETTELQHLMYGGYFSGGSGLQSWKRRLGFQQAYFVLREASGRAMGTATELACSRPSGDVLF